MVRETKADLDQLLTPRERETLDLLRLGLTNREIAGRLDISVAGVRYHVSEIIGKLGVRNRYEAAAWPERPPWWLSAVAPIALFGRRTVGALPVRASAVALAASGILLLAMVGGAGSILFLLLRDGGTAGPPSAAACPSRPAPQVETGADLSFDEVADLVAEAITCPGYVLRVRSSGEVEAGPYTSQQETDVWVDLANGLGRMEARISFTSAEPTAEATATVQEPPAFGNAAVYVGDVEYYREDASPPDLPRFGREQKDEADLCHGSGHAALELIIPCDILRGEQDFWVEQGTSYAGRGAVVLVAAGVPRGPGIKATTRWYFDAATFLPLGATAEGTADASEIGTVESYVSSQATFLRLDSVPDDIFDPASIGYLDRLAEDIPDALDALDLGMQVYWLGPELPETSGPPALELSSALVYRVDGVGMGSEPTARRAVRLTYSQPGEDAALVTLDLWRREDWERYMEGSDASFVGPCTRRLEVTIEQGGDPVIRRLGLPDDACAPVFYVQAHVYLDGTFVKISVPVPSGEGLVAADELPYNTEAAIELLVRSLVARD